MGTGHASWYYCSMQHSSKSGRHIDTLIGAHHTTHRTFGQRASADHSESAIAISLVAQTPASSSSGQPTSANPASRAASKKRSSQKRCVGYTRSTSVRRGVQRAVSVPTRSPNLRASLETHAGSPRRDERPDLGGISARLSGAYRRSDPTIRSTAPSRVSARRRTRAASEASPQVRGSCSTRVRGETRRAVGRGGITWGRVAVHGYSRGIPHHICLKAARDDV